jgi:dimeric dUTPase (all-alpha-NTP-PPase superfamily)
MDLTKLFDMQRELDLRIVKEKGLEEQEFLPKKILALQVELGELANEWRGFKFWSEDQEPRTEHDCKVCEGEGSITLLTESINNGEQVTFIDCQYCNGDGYLDKNPLLEEYVDCLHFILSIGLRLDIDCGLEYDETWVIKEEDITKQFLWLNDKVGDLSRFRTTWNYDAIFELFIGLGEMLGFTWDEIENAYFEKNKINHERQNNGY